MPAIITEEVQFTVVPNELELRVIRGPARLPRDDKEFRYISVDTWFCYPDLKEYYGPSNIIHILKFVEILQHQLRVDPDRAVCLVAKAHSAQGLNCVLMAAAYMHLVHGISSQDAYKRLGSVIEMLGVRHYKTEGEFMKEDPKITIADCLQGLEQMIDKKLLHPTAIDIDATLHRECPFHGDMNWIIPDKILALASPTEDVYPIEEFIHFARQNQINTMVRLNRPHYDSQIVQNHGIRHVEMFMADGGTPSWDQIGEFYQVAEAAWSAGAMAVHCRAGLGRTGTMIATFLIRKFALEASHVIAYLRMMRPGSVLGIQARFLHTVQYALRGEATPGDCLGYLQEYYPDNFDTLLTSTESASESDNTFNDSNGDDGSHSIGSVFGSFGVTRCN